MSTITLPNIRVSSDLTVRVRLKDGGVAIDWSTLTKIKASIYSDAQRALAGRCDVSIDAEDSTLLVCSYAANKPQYVGVNRIVVSAKYMGETKTYDKPAFNFVRWTADQEGEQITIDDPDVDVEIDVEDISSSILQEAVEAAFDAADRANDAAAAAEHMVDIHTGPEGKSAYEVAVEEGYTGTEEEWLASLVGPQGPQGIQGETGEAAGFGTASASLTEDGGNPGVTVAASGSDTAKNFAFTFKNLKGDKGDKGDQGNTGSSVDYPYELVNNLTTNDATKGLTAAMGVQLEGEVSQLQQKLHKSETQSPSLQRDGYYVNTDGARAYYSPFGIFTPIPVKTGDRIVATIDGLNSACSPISWGATDNTTSSMSVTPLAVYSPTNHYDVTIENDGYLIISGNKASTPIVTIYGEMYDFEQIDINNENIEKIQVAITDETQVPIVSVLGDYYVNTSGTRAWASGYAIFGGIPVLAGEKFRVNVPGIANIICPVAWSETDNTTSSMQTTPLAEYDASGQYEVEIPANGYLYLSGLTAQPPTLYKLSFIDFDQIKENVNDLSEKVADIDGALDDNTQIPVVIDKDGYFVNTSGTRGSYAPFAIFSPVSVKAGDKIIVGNIYVNAAICPLAFNTDGNTTSTMVTTTMTVFEAGKTEYSAVAPQDGYFIVSNDRTKTPTVEIAKLLDIPEIKQIGSLLSGKITMLFGDSLTAGSTTGVVAFGRVIANVLGIPYRAFVYDRFDPSPNTNAADVDIDIPSITNYGKDGTKNQLTTGRVDSVLQRIKNHITADTNVDYVLVECCINDYTSGTKGAITASYTGPFDENTAIGAIEETCRYLSTLGKPIRFGFYIPWQISYVPESYFNDYIPVFEKWAVPLFDMRKCAGFDMRNCARHQELYSLPSSSYADYDNTATYNLDDKVKYQGFLYKCNADGVTGIIPTDETYWTKVSEGSFDGCHLNSIGHYIVAGKIQSFIERL